MITFAENKANVIFSIGPYTNEEVEQKYLDMVPSLTKMVRTAFKEYDPEKREDALECVLVQSYMNVRSLAEQGRLHDAFHSPIGRFAIAAYKDGRPGGFEMNSTDVLGEATKTKKRVEVDSLEPFDDMKHSWSECFVTDGRINVANEVSFKLDCEAWMNTLDWKRREILEAMIVGDTTTELSQRFKVSPGRISQYRREFWESWKEFRNTYDYKHRNDDLVEELIRMAEEDERAAKERAGV